MNAEQSQRSVEPILAVTIPVASSTRLRLLNAFLTPREELTTRDFSERVGMESLTHCRNELKFAFNMGLLLRLGAGGRDGYRYKLNTQHKSVKLFVVARRLARHA